MADHVDYYADSSVLVKRHVHERGTHWFRALAAPEAGNVIITARISMVEVYSALSRRRREATISDEAYDQLVADFTTICMADYQFVELTLPVVEQARLLLARYALRAYDAVQLASAILTQQTLQAIELPPLTFLAADDRLLDAAQAEGLVTDNPNLYL